jgi:hypothetical protein
MPLMEEDGVGGPGGDDYRERHHDDGQHDDDCCHAADDENHKHQHEQWDEQANNNINEKDEEVYQHHRHNEGDQKNANKVQPLMPLAVVALGNTASSQLVLRVEEQVEQREQQQTINVLGRIKVISSSSDSCSIPRNAIATSTSTSTSKSSTDDSADTAVTQNHSCGRAKETRTSSTVAHGTVALALVGQDNNNKNNENKEYHPKEYQQKEEEKERQRGNKTVMDVTMNDHDEDQQPTMIRSLINSNQPACCQNVLQTDQEVSYHNNQHLQHKKPKCDNNLPSTTTNHVCNRSTEVNSSSTSTILKGGSSLLACCGANTKNVPSLSGDTSNIMLGVQSNDDTAAISSVAPTTASTNSNADKEEHAGASNSSFSNLLLLDTEQEIVKPHENDVLSGRGAGINQHPGNVYYRNLVQAYKMEYFHSSSSQKKIIIQRIVDKF